MGANEGVSTRALVLLSLTCCSAAMHADGSLSLAHSDSLMHLDRLWKNWSQLGIFNLQIFGS